MHEKERDVLEPGLPWWEFVLRAVVVYGVLLLLVRLCGKRSIGQFTPFDMILQVLLGSSVQNSLIGDDVSLIGGLILAATLLALHYAFGWITSRNARLQTLIEGEPVLLARDGEVLDAQLKRECISPADFDEAMRRSGIRKRGDIACAWLETDGRITLLPIRQEPS